MEERIGRVKVRKLMGWDKDSLIGKAKAAHVSEEKQRINSPLPMGRQGFSHPQESRAPSPVTVTWEDKHHNAECPPLPSSSPAYVLSVVSYGMEYPFGQLGSAVLAVSPPNSPCPSSPLAGRARGTDKSLI